MTPFTPPGDWGFTPAEGAARIVPRPPRQAKSVCVIGVSINRTLSVCPAGGLLRRRVVTRAGCQAGGLSGGRQLHRGGAPLQHAQLLRRADG